MRVSATNMSGSDHNHATHGNGVRATAAGCTSDRIMKLHCAAGGLSELPG